MPPAVYSGVAVREWGRPSRPAVASPRLPWVGREEIPTPVRELVLASFAGIVLYSTGLICHRA